MAGSPERLRGDEAAGTVLTFLRTVALIAAHEPSVSELMALLEISRATLKRRIALARACGVMIVRRRDGAHQYYVVEDFGPFDPDGLQRTAALLSAPIRPATLKLPGPLPEDPAPAPR
jgi:hypothetical protein